MRKATHKKLIISLLSQSFAGSLSTRSQRSQKRHQSFQKFPFISMDAGDIGAALYHDLSKLQEDIAKTEENIIREDHQS